MAIGPFKGKVDPGRVRHVVVKPGLSLEHLRV